MREDEEGELVKARGSRLPLKVGKELNAKQVLDAAVKKHSDHDQFFSEDDNYVLIYPDQKIVEKVPGTNEEFAVANYKKELAKPYSKCDLYICKASAFFTEAEGSVNDETADETKAKTQTKIPFKVSKVVDVHGSVSDEESDHELDHSVFEAINGQDGRVVCPTCLISFQINEIEEHADMCCDQQRTSEELTYNDLMSTLHVNTSSQNVMCDQSNGDNAADEQPTCSAAEVPNPPDIKDILKGISNHVDKKIFRIHVRRKFLWEDFLESRKRPWVKPCHTIKIDSVKTEAELRNVLLEDTTLDALQKVGYRGVPQRETMSGKERILRYIPPVWGRSGHVQTVFAGKVGRVNSPKLHGTHHVVIMKDGATMTFDVYEPDATKSEEKLNTVIVVPGIANCSDTKYVRTFAGYALKHNFRVAVLNHLGVREDIELTSPRIFTYGVDLEIWAHEHSYEGLLPVYNHKVLVIVIV
ncbi:hypothetical protein QZH41_006146 [Actinostola sp. cb2023]|nr:hypothetical protein QZH41_006146 [Actinostola sp. cb2023]